MPIQLAVATYDQGHWTLYAAKSVKDKKERGTMFEAKGSTTSANSDSDFREMKNMIEEVPMRNRVKYWDCQNWIIDVLDAMEEQSLIEADDTYTRAKAALVKIIDESRPEVISDQEISSEEEEGADEEDRGREEGEEANGVDDEDDEDEEDEEEKPRSMKSVERIDDSDEE